MYTAASSCMGRGRLLFLEGSIYAETSSDAVAARSAPP